MNMIIKVEISEETWARMLTGKRVEGTLCYDTWTGSKTFRMFHRLSRLKPHDELVRKLPWGWVKRSKMRWKTYISVSRDLPLDEVMANMEHDHELAKEAIVDQAIIDNV